MVKISVVIPVYNVEEYLEESILCLFNQTFEDFELICVNDGSKDNSLDILKKFAKIDPRVIIINKENGGCGSARNRGLDEAKGDYIYFFDPDDYIVPNAFEDLYNNITNNKSDFVIFKFALFMEGEPVDYSRPTFDLDEIFKDADFNNFTFTYKDVKRHVLNSSFAPWTKLYRADFLNKYDDFRFDLGVAFDDVPFHVKSMLRAKKISFAPDYYYHYRYANPNSVNNTSSNGIDIMKIIDIVEDFLKKEKYFDELKNEFFCFKINHITIYMISTNSDEYFKLAKQKLLELNEDDLKEIPKDLLKKYYLIVESNSLKEYKSKLRASSIKEDATKIFNNITGKNKENTLKKEIQSSNIWKSAKIRLKRFKN